ncbi:hypothetical protein J5U18_07495 [Sphingobacteriaceae bacterium WQ 2009]|uniref:Holin-X, holin superfamily III n=1 Tax=Rhinopithecimicrobium faecis TaxID=2820698 RepID=A0A8T4HAV2_9SPHI|nr:hypothetical protein [Sphingobacteriaceae bacterium WQ 2009]
MEEEEKFSFSGTIQKSKEYIDSQLKLIRLKTIERSSRLAGSLIVDATKLIFVLFIIFFLCLALGFYLGEVLGSYSLGFLATAGIFLVIIIVISIFEEKIERKFMDLSIRRFLRKWNDESEDSDKVEKKDEETQQDK